MVTRRGFTLIELIVVVAVIAILAAVAVPMVDVVQTRARSDSTLEEMSSLRTALESYYADHLAFPATLDGLEQDGRIASAFRSGDAFQDGWGNAYTWQPGAETATVTSFGPDQTAADPNLTLTVDGRRFLIERTRDDMETIHIALRNYESVRVQSGLDPLPGTWYDAASAAQSALGRLVAAGDLPNSTRYAADAWGAIYIYDGTPADRVRSRTLDGAGGGSTIGGGGSGNQEGGGGHGTGGDNGNGNGEGGGNNGNGNGNGGGDGSNGGDNGNGGDGGNGGGGGNNGNGNGNGGGDGSNGGGNGNGNSGSGNSGNGHGNEH